MSNQGATGRTRWQSNSESGPSRLNNIDDELFAKPVNLSIHQYALYHQSQQTIPTDLYEGFIESHL